MASNGSSAGAGNAESSLEKIKRQLTSGSGKYLLQGPILKRSETLRKWNERWVILDPTTGKMEYKIRRNEPAIKGTIMFDSNSIITNSPINIHGLPKYDGCCFYVGTPKKKEYFFCAESPGAAKGWVSTLHATQLVLRAHREAVNNLSGSGSSQLGTVATVVAAANLTAMEASKEIETAMKISLRTALGSLATKPNDAQLDDLTIMKETIKVKDEELHQLAKDLRARDFTIKEITDKLVETVEAAETAASAAHTMDEERRLACAEIGRLRKDAEKYQGTIQLKLKEYEEKVKNLSQERELLLKQRESALQETHLWRSELAKARERAVVLEAAVVRAEERARIAEVDSEARVKDAVEKTLTAIKVKEDLLALVHRLQSQVQRQGSSKQVFEERSDAHSTPDDTLPMTKHVDLSEDDVDKACLNDPRPLLASSESEIQVGVDGVDIHSVTDANWHNFQSSTARMANVREISPEAEGNSLDISVDNEHGGSSLQP
ncbi:switch-associated protein 70-like [Zingiber officinale]|uniref:switch-associated protein 70-like n=1 Tax=Zingiber officinale TaxID=94328 RepID=UPI001C4C5249|nr:switch-associated protein 70-like [Zingiber officinale]